MQEYRERLADWHRRREGLERRAARLLRLRRVLLGVIVALCILAEKEKVATKIVLILTPALLLEGADRWRRRTHGDIATAERAVVSYEDRLALISGCGAGRGPAGERFLDPDHLYATDLDLFGRGGAFERISRARSSAGEATVASWLKTPAPPVEVRERQAAAAELRGALALREELELLDPPHCVDTEPLRAWSRDTVDLPFGYRPIAWALVAGILVSAVGNVVFAFDLAPLVVFLLLGASFARILRRRSAALLNPIADRAADFRLLAELARRIERGSYVSPVLARLRSEVASAPLFQLARLLRRLDAKKALPAAPLSALVLLTTRTALAAAAWRRRHGEAFDGWLRTMGILEALISLGGYAFESPDASFPEFADGGPLFDAEGLTHPLLPPGRGVANDIRLDATKPLLVVSGSNMSGKSTFLRAVGLTVALAQAGAVVHARRLTLSPLTVGATLRVQDSLAEGKSRFYAEVLRVRRIVEAAKGERPLLFLLDEMFAGTNETDRARGAEAVVRALVAADAIGLVTTHDAALTQLADALAPRAGNAHFGDRVAGDDLVFDYTLHWGPAPRGNALALLRAAGFDV